VRGQIPYCGPSSRGDVPAPHRQQVCGESVVAASIDRGPARGHTSRPPVIHAARPRERALIEAMRVCVCVRACVCPLSTSMRMSGFTCMRASRRHPNKTNTDAGTRAGCVRLYATISTHAVSSREQRRARLRPLRFKRRGGAGRGGGGRGGASGCITTTSSRKETSSRESSFRWEFRTGRRSGSCISPHLRGRR